MMNTFFHGEIDQIKTSSCTSVQFNEGARHYRIVSGLCCFQFLLNSSYTITRWVFAIYLKLYTHMYTYIDAQKIQSIHMLIRLGPALVFVGVLWSYISRPVNCECWLHIILSVRWQKNRCVRHGCLTSQMNPQIGELHYECNNYPSNAA